MELKRTTANLQDKQSHTKPPSLAVEVEAPVEYNDGIVEKEKSDGLKTPTSPLNRIHPILTCPAAPRKPMAAQLRKRKGHNTKLRLLDFSNDVLALYPPALLADFGNKVKKARRDHHEQLKENISINTNIKLLH